MILHGMNVNWLNTPKTGEYVPLFWKNSCYNEPTYMTRNKCLLL